MKHKKIILLTIFLICFTAISAVNASDNATDTLESDQSSDGDIVNVEDDNIIESPDGEDIKIRVDPVIIIGGDDESDVVFIDSEFTSGNISVLIDDVEKCNKKIGYYSQIWITPYELDIPFGEYNMKVKFINDTTTKELYNGTLTKTYYLDVNDDIEFDEFYDDVLFYDYSWNYGVSVPRDATGTLTVEFNGNVARLDYDRSGKAKSSLIIDGLQVGEYKIKVSLTNDQYYPNKTIEHPFYVIPKIDTPYNVAVGETEFITVEFPKNYKGKVVVYNCTYHDTFDMDEYYEIDQEIGSANVVNGLAKVPVKNLVLGRNHITIKCIGDGNYEYEDLIKYAQNSQRFSSSINSNTVEVGNDVILRMDVPKSSNDLYVYVDNDLYKEVSLNGGAITEYISKLNVGEHHIKLVFEGNSETYSNSFYVTVKEKTPEQNSKTPTTPAADKPAAKTTLTLNTVKVKKSSKKITIKATLKENGKAVMGKKLIFKFNGKKYTAKTNKKGIAKITINKNVLKKLKVGKKVKYQVSCDKAIAKKTVKIQK